MRSFDIGQTISRAFGLIRKSLPGVGLFALIVQAISALLQFFMQNRLLSEVEGLASSTDPFAPLSIFGSFWYWGSMLVSFALGSIVFAGSIDGMLKADRDAAPAIGECFQTGIAKMLPVLGLTVLWLLGVALGWMLLIVPGIILMTMWSASLPALLGENIGVFASFGRSRTLTRGSRASIFVVLLILLIIIYGLMIGVAGAMIGSSLFGYSANTIVPEASLGYSLAMIPVGWLLGLILSATLVSIYLETIEIKEGGTQGKLTDVFA